MPKGGGIGGGFLPVEQVNLSISHLGLGAECEVAHWCTGAAALGSAQVTVAIRYFAARN